MSTQDIRCSSHSSGSASASLLLGHGGHLGRRLPIGWVSLILVGLLTIFNFEKATAQTIGPGAVAGPVITNALTGNLTVVGNTQVTAGTTASGTSVTAGTLTFDPNAAGFPAGPVSVQTVNGHALFVN